MAPLLCTQAHEYAGEADPTSNPLVFSLVNTAAAPLPDGVVPMPPDMLLRGAAAACMLQCQVGVCVGCDVMMSHWLMHAMMMMMMRLCCSVDTACVSTVRSDTSIATDIVNTPHTV